MSTTAESFSPRRVRLGSVEPAIDILLKQLDPVIVVITLFACQLGWGQRISTPLVALALFTFIVSGQVFAYMQAREPSGFTPTTDGASRIYSRTLVKWAVVVACLLMAAFAFKTGAIFSRRVILTWFVVTPVLLSAAHALRLQARWRASLSIASPRYIIVGVNQLGVELQRRLPSSGFLGFFDFRSIERISQRLDPDRLAGHCRDLADYVRTHGVNVVYIALPLVNVPRMSELINALRDTTASVYFVPDVFAFDLIQGRIVEINGIPALSVCDTPFHGVDAVLKRATDLLFGTLALLLALPLMLVIALAVKLTSRGPVLFHQRRYGLHGEQIIVYKFRSMTVCEDGPMVAQATRFDLRVTKVGRLLRKTSLDELPQLFNVIEGTMSLVGPRPHAVAHNEQYRKLIDGYMIRHKVRPGMTGLAQVNGLRGETATLDKMSARVRYDLEYLRHWSPWLDVKILIKTLLIVLSGDRHNAY
jgi:putative colanic acid biosysnthesis UDP-glucose lipid carrier transferase